MSWFGQISVQCAILNEAGYTLKLGNVYELKVFNAPKAKMIRVGLSIQIACSVKAAFIKQN